MGLNSAEFGVLWSELGQALWKGGQGGNSDGSVPTDLSERLLC